MPLFRRLAVGTATASVKEHLVTIFGTGWQSAHTGQGLCYIITHMIHVYHNTHITRVHIL